MNQGENEIVGALEKKRDLKGRNSLSFSKSSPPKGYRNFLLTVTATETTRSFPSPLAPQDILLEGFENHDSDLMRSVGPHTLLLRV
ncbi:hypothetical protein VNO77_19310 [Canavalia gladiata]|uniref:Uncharacterized protein n=1 Tax=Canavalia gladiata TaxID=3824 RepID=A0AAN9LM94_CANGL